MRKIVLMALASAMALSMAGCGCSKSANPADMPTERPAMAGVMVIPENWDGVTFTSTDGKITIVAPEEGWTCTKSDDNNLVIVNGEETVSYGEADIEDISREPKDEETVRKRLEKVFDISEFELNNAEEDKFTYSYLAQPKDDVTTSMKFVITEVDGNTRTVKTAIAAKDDQARMNELKEVLNNNITINN